MLPHTKKSSCSIDGVPKTKYYPHFVCSSILRGTQNVATLSNSSLYVYMFLCPVSEFGFFSPLLQHRRCRLADCWFSMQSTEQTKCPQNENEIDRIIKIECYHIDLSVLYWITDSLFLSLSVLWPFFELVFSFLFEFGFFFWISWKILHFRPTFEFRIQKIPNGYCFLPFTVSFVIKHIPFYGHQMANAMFGHANRSPFPRKSQFFFRKTYAIKSVCVWILFVLFPVFFPFVLFISFKMIFAHCFVQHIFQIIKLRGSCHNTCSNAN